MGPSCIDGEEGVENVRAWVRACVREKGRKCPHGGEIENITTFVFLQRYQLTICSIYFHLAIERLEPLGNCDS